ncbi:C40 family peptidase [Mycobacteroides abscessus]|uniref:C40 family peptidase n=1 Tax=Mycobacteroides abscessus TaxID=36809 RepID=UPI000C260026|nr:NlpC/P60 family protein [Mycobacteroides abscessus]
MNIMRPRGGRAPLDEKGSIPVPIRFGRSDLARIDEAWAKFGSADRSAFIRQAASEKATAVLNAEAESHAASQRAQALERKQQTTVLTAVEAELFAAAGELVGRRTPYAWGGGTITGPTLGIHDGGGPADLAGDFKKVGFDAGSLEQYLVFRAFHLEIPRTPREQFRFGQPATEPQAGDLVFFEEHMIGDLPTYVATYLGRGCIAEARKSGDLIAISALPATGIQLRRMITH